MRNDLPRSRPIVERVEHNRSSVSLAFDYDCKFQPGQFVMAWLPGVEEKPFSVSRHREGLVEITLKRRGPTSDRMADLRVGDLMGLRGPYGSGFTAGEDCCFVAGGVGLAALAPLIERFPQAPVLYGENSADDWMLRERFPQMRVFSVDGSGGETGFPTDALPEILEGPDKPKTVYACGPEVMMVKVARLCDAAGVDSQLSLERYMKCAVGVCGQCCLDGLRVCADGPVFSGAQLLHNADFGVRHLDKSGSWIYWER